MPLLLNDQRTMIHFFNNVKLAYDAPGILAPKRLIDGTIVPVPMDAYAAAAMTSDVLEWTRRGCFTQGKAKQLYDVDEGTNLWTVTLKLNASDAQRPMIVASSAAAAATRRWLPQADGAYLLQLVDGKSRACIESYLTIPENLIGASPKASWQSQPLPSEHTLRFKDRMALATEVAMSADMSRTEFIAGLKDYLGEASEVLDPTVIQLFSAAKLSEHARALWTWARI